MVRPADAAADVPIPARLQRLLHSRRAEVRADRRRGEGRLARVPVPPVVPGGVRSAVNEPRFHATPEEAVARRVREKVFVEGRTFLIERPDGTDQAFDHPAVRSAFASDDYTPYWADLWPAGRMLAKAILKFPWPREPMRVLEIGCGLGLGGLAALACGHHVTFADCDETAVQFAVRNAMLYGYANFAARPMDVRSPPGVTFPVIVGSDLMYEYPMVEPLAAFLKAVLSPNGVALITDPDRKSSRHFGDAARDVGLHVAPEFVRAGEPGGERTKGTLYRLMHAPEFS